tara:strand:+ start:25 stop:657 length:633 start_codon:yes stop_codon:yes gene_type:complete
MIYEVNSDLFTYEELSSIVNRLSKLDEELEEMLNSFHPNDVRDQIEETKQWCNPVNLLNGLMASFLDDDDSEFIELNPDLRSITLEQEFFKCETTDWMIDSWAGLKSSNQWAPKPHPWARTEDLAKYPKELNACFESILSSYFTLTKIGGNRRDAWSFWSKRIFSGGSKSIPKKDDENKWIEMQRLYFETQNKRRDFLKNLIAAIESPSV